MTEEQINRLAELEAQATPGKVRVAMHGYNVKSDLTGTDHDGDYYENIFSVPCGPKATIKAVEQFEHDADLYVELRNAAPSIIADLRAYRALEKAARGVARDVCSLLCPSERIGEEWKHHPECVALRAALAAIEEH